MSRRDITMKALMEWAIATKRADRHAAARGVIERDGPVGPRGAGAYIAGEVVRLGVKVQASAVPLRVDLDPDADRVFCLAEDLLAQPILVLVVRHALLRAVPDWGDGLRRFEASPVIVWTKRAAPGFTKVAGQVVWQVAGQGHWPQVRTAGGRTGTSSPFCPVVYEDRGAMLEQMRDDYSAWWRGLDRVRTALLADAGRLHRFAVQAVGAPRRPWEDRVKKSC